MWMYPPFRHRVLDVIAWKFVPEDAPIPVSLEDDRKRAHVMNISQ